eukprot:1171220-Lingulodinium_polyedra.AAC.1
MLLYPAHIDLPANRAVKVLEVLYARAARTTGWALCFVVGAIAILWGIKGAPRCPTAAGRA